MQWIRKFDLFLFDFDGLLVNTEHLHYQAYLNMLAKRGLALSLSFAHFQTLAHLNSTAWKEALYTEFPDLEPNWQILYNEKKEAFEAILASGKVELMPGVKTLLEALEAANIRRCVVTHSNLYHVELIRSQFEILKRLPHWITREDYDKPKPDPECYLKAIALHGKTGDRIIGFEDSIRGLNALKKTPALPILICSKHHPLLEMALADGGTHYESIVDLDQKESFGGG